MTGRLYIVAELAQGFEGSEDQARLLVRAAHASLADAAKFQLVFADELATPDYRHYSLFKSLELSETAWKRIAAYAHGLAIDLHFDVFGRRSLQLAQEIDAQIKIHPTDIANQDLLDDIAQSSVSTVFLGIGGASRTEILEAVVRLDSKSVVLVLGFQGYPTPVSANQLIRLRSLQETFRDFDNVRYGFADHSSLEGLATYGVAAAAVGLGASVIEKHLTLGRIVQMEDHESALNPDEFRQFRELLDTCTTAVGCCLEEEDFGMTHSENEYRGSVRRQVVTRRAMRAGEQVSREDLALKRTNGNEALTSLAHAVDRVLAHDVPVDFALGLSDFR